MSKIHNLKAAKPLLKNAEKHHIESEKFCEKTHQKKSVSKAAIFHTLAIPKINKNFTIL